MSPWQWLELVTADISAVGPAAVPALTSGANYVGGSRVGRVDAWNSFTRLGTRFVGAGLGGHTDWAGNEGYECDLAAASPVFVMLGAPSSDANIRLDVTHYADGRPTSSHIYYGMHGDEVRGKIFRMGVGSAYGSGNFQARSVDAFDVGTEDWDAAGTWPDVPETLEYGKAQCQDPRTGDVYVVGNTRLYRFNIAAGTFSTLALIPSNGSAAYYRASAVDTLRNRVVILGNAYASPNGILIYDITAGTFSTGTMTGSYAATVGGQSAAMADYSAARDSFIVCTGAGAQVVEVDASTFATSAITTSGGTPPSPASGCFQKFVPMPSLGGYAYQPTGASKLWFLADS